MARSKFVITNSVSTTQWTKQERMFAVEAYFSFNRSIIANQREFRKHFNIALAGRVPDRKSMFVSEHVQEYQ